MKYTIESVSKMTSIPAASLRNWEKRYGFPKPERTEGGHRYYSSKDVEFLQQVMIWIEEGMPLHQVAERYDSFCILDSRARANGRPDLVDDVHYRTELVYKSLLNLDTNGVQQHYQILVAKLAPEQLFDRVFEVILRRLGEEWAQGKVSIAQEHFASAFVRNKLSSFLAIDFPSTQKQKIIAATLSEERHEGGLMLVSAHLKFRGYPVYYFGADLPIEDLQKVCAELKPQVVALSYVDPARVRRDLDGLKSMSCQLCLGGIAFHDPSLHDEIFGKLPAHIQLVSASSGSQAAEKLELILQQKNL